jgi:hypothetical protein
VIAHLLKGNNVFHFFAVAFSEMVAQTEMDFTSMVEHMHPILHPIHKIGSAGFFNGVWWFSLYALFNWHLFSRFFFSIDRVV